jgi:hypothetical protein
MSELAIIDVQISTESRIIGSMAKAAKPEEPLRLPRHLLRRICLTLISISDLGITFTDKTLIRELEEILNGQLDQTLRDKLLKSLEPSPSSTSTTSTSTSKALKRPRKRTR